MDKQEILRQRIIGATFVIAILYIGNLISYLIPPREDNKNWLSFLGLILLIFIGSSKPSKTILYLAIFFVILGIALQFLLK